MRDRLKGKMLIHTEGVYAEQISDTPADNNLYHFVWVEEETIGTTETGELQAINKTIILAYLETWRICKELYARAEAIREKRIKRWLKTKKGRSWLHRWRRAKHPKGFEFDEEEWELNRELDEVGGNAHRKIVASELRRLGTYSLDPAFAEFEYLSPPATCSIRKVNEWLVTICAPFSCLREGDFEWARKTFHSVACVGRLLKAAEMDKAEILRHLNRLWALNYPDRESETEEFRLFVRVIASFPRSLIDHLAKTLDLRKCAHPHCTSGPFFFPRRDWQTHCTPQCRIRHGHVRYYAGKKRRKKTRKTS